MSFEQTFSSTTLDVAVPDTSLDFPSQESLDDWLDRIRSGSVDRKQSFFDEQLHAFLILRVNYPGPESDVPPQALLSFLSHLQVSFEATYISPVLDTQQDARIINFSNPPRGSSLPKGSARMNLHPSILPPNTPNPMPATAEQDRKYVTSEGTFLLAGIWGQNASQDADEDFTLLWSPAEEVWVAVYSFSFTVSYLRLNVPDPLLCLTASATLRDKPITTASAKHPFASYLAKVGAQLSLSELKSPVPVNGEDNNDSTEEDELQGFEEVNLLQGLYGGPTFGNDSSTLFVPSIRLGTVSRQKLFSLPPINLPTPTPAVPSPMTALRAVHPTLRKSFRKTLHTASGFRVRMRTVFVPYMLLPRRTGSSSKNWEDERDRREAGNEERTVVLCIEIENSSDSGPNIGFEVEKVEVKVGGDDADTQLIGWDEASLRNTDEGKIFPLRIDSSSQYNLLYAVSFLHPPDELNALSLGSSHNTPRPDLQRAVAIYIYGKPYERRFPSPSDAAADLPPLLYPTRTFSSRWNCVLDLGIRDYHNPDSASTFDPTSPTNNYPSALPEPASPFPLSSSRAGGFPSPDQLSPATTPRSSLIAGIQRLSLPLGTPASARSFSPAKTPNRYSDQQLYTPPSSRQSYLPPSQSLTAAAAHLLQSPTTYTAPATSPGLFVNDNNYDEPGPPLTPAYPPHSPFPPSPISQNPISSQGAGSVGPSVETRRERGFGLGLTSTPGPSNTASVPDQQQHTSTKLFQQRLDGGESVVISVRLMSSQGKEDQEDREDGNERIFPLSRFTIEAFVYNRSSGTRRFELSYPSTARSRRKERPTSQSGTYNFGGIAGEFGHPGILPIDNRVRIGPLLPSTCQTVRMQFLALMPGVHSIDMFTLTDIESGHSVNLRSSMDIVVHEFP